jgi:uncharacterized membrane protein
MKQFFSKFTRTEKFYVLILTVVSVAVMMPVLIYGLPNGHDLPHHYQCATTFIESIRAGDFYPSWSGNRNFGFGGMETRLYPPVSHYTLAVFYLVIGDWHLASWLVFTLLTFLGSLGVYLWARETMPAANAVFAGFIYALLPYHLNQLYNTFFLAEFAGSAVLPFTFVFISRVGRRGKLIDVLGLGAAYAALILTHLPLTVIGSLFFAVYALTLLRREKLFSQLGKLTAGVAIAALASSFFWTKVLLERDWMAKASVYPEPMFDYRLNFLFTAIQKYEGIGQTVYENGTLFYDLMLFFALLVAAAGTIPFFIAKRKIEFPDKGVPIVLALAVFLTSPFSGFIWARISILQEVQFPWRFLTIVCLAAALLAASQIHLLCEWFNGKKRPFALIIAGCILAMISFSGGQIIRPAPFIERREVRPFLAKNETDIGLEFWWTIWTRKDFSKIKEPVVAENRAARLEKWTATEKRFELAEGTPLEARLAVFYHPNWKARVNELPTAIKPDSDGAVLIPVTAEKSTVSLTFQEPFTVRTARLISLLSWLLLLPLIVFARRLNRPNKKNLEPASDSNA